MIDATWSENTSNNCTSDGTPIGEPKIISLIQIQFKTQFNYLNRWC